MFSEEIFYIYLWLDFSKGTHRSSVMCSRLTKSYNYNVIGRVVRFEENTF